MAAWRVRKLKPKGAPEVVYGRDGLPLFLPLDADIEDLRRETRGDGRYRLDPVDEHNRTVPNAPAGYVCVHPIERAPEPAAPAQPAAAAAQVEITHALVGALLESQKQHTEMARMYVSQFSVVSNAMAGVVRSAGDAGLTARVPLVLPAAPEVKAAESAKPDDDTDDDETDDDETETDDDEIESDQIAVETAPQPEYSWARVAQTFADHVTPHVGPLLEGLPGLAAMLGAKRASTASDAARGPDRSDPAPAEAASGAPSGPALGFDAGMLIRLNAIKARLTPGEREFAQMLIDEIAPEELPVWIGRLRSMSLDEAVAYVREKYREGQAAADRARPVEASATTAPSAAPRSAPPRAAVRPTAPTAPGDARRGSRRPMTSPISESAPHGAPTAPKRVTRPPTPSNGLGLLDEGTQAHLAAIDQSLTLDEAAALRKQFAALSPRDRASWVATLVLLPVADAVAAIRTQLAIADAPIGTTIPAIASAGPETPDAPAASVTTARAPSASPLRDSSSPAGAREAALTDVVSASTHDQAGPSALSTEPLVAPTTAPSEPVHAIDRNADMHLAEVEHALTPDERVRMHAMFGRLSPDERDIWLDRLLSAPPGQGTAMLRDALANGTTQPLTAAPAISGAPLAIAKVPDEGHVSPGLMPVDAIAHREPGSDAAELDEITERISPDETAKAPEIIELDETAELDETPEPDEAAELDEAAEAADLDDLDDAEDLHDTAEASETIDLDGTADLDEATAARGEAHTARAVASRPVAPVAESATAEAYAGQHLAAIEAALTLAEKMRAHELASQRPIAELRRWYAELLRLSVPDAVAKIRAELARIDRDSRATKKGDVS